MKPALTPEEWRTIVIVHDAEPQPGYLAMQGGLGAEEAHIRTEERGCFLDDAARAKVAAYCLHGQPFGFTWEDVDRLLRKAKEAYQPDARAPYDDEWTGADKQEQEFLNNLANRIAALLPPKESQDE